MQDFIDMGGYGAYVWPSYILTGVVMAVLLIASIRTLTKTEATFKRLKAETAPQKEQQAETANGDEAQA
ncbi:heme exporter protein CcmD [Pseudomonadota bacterium]